MATLSKLQQAGKLPAEPSPSLQANTVPLALQQQLQRFCTNLHVLRQNLDEVAEKVSQLPSSGPLVLESLRCQFFLNRALSALEDFQVHNYDRSTAPYEGTAFHYCNRTSLCLSDIQIHLHGVCGAQESELSFDPAAMDLFMEDTMQISDHIDVQDGMPRSSGIKMDKLVILLINVVLPLRIITQTIGDIALVIDADDSRRTSHGRGKVEELSARLDVLEKNLLFLSTGFKSFATIAIPILLSKHKRRAAGNTAMSAAALLFANTVASVGNAQLFSAQGDAVSSSSSRSAEQAVQALWSISLGSGIFASLLAAAAAYWNDAMWSKSRSTSSSRRRKALYRLFFELGPVGVLALSVLTFFGGLCVSPYHLHFGLSIKIITYIVSGACVLFLALIFAITMRDDHVELFGPNETWHRLWDEKAKAEVSADVERAVKP
ncbi:hypothetical protein OC834_001578 [Tilletia horrida]|nr:hypothetical protein OC834_001578 [Tilletia horrida]